MIYASIESSKDNVNNFLYIRQLSDKMAVGAMRGLTSVSKDIVKQTRAKITEPKTGIKYKSLRNRSSKAGEYPASQTGRLRKGIGFQMQGVRRSYIGSEAPYSKYLAFGTRYMQKRRFIGTTIQENLNNAYDKITTEINKEIKI